MAQATAHRRRDHVVVTGAAGFIGSHLAEELLRDGRQVVGIDAFTPAYAREEKLRNVVGLSQDASFVMVEDDLCRMDLRPWLAGARAVAHLAGEPGVGASWGEAFRRYATHNIVATQRLLDACVACGVRRVVVASSSSVYGDHAGRASPVDARLAPASPYGVTKLAVEHLCGAYQMAHGLPVTILRYFTVYGPRQRPDMAFHRFLAAVLAGQPVVVFGDGEQTRDYTYVGDAAHATALALAAALTPEGPIDVGGGTPASVNTVLGHISRLLGRPVTVEHHQARQGDVRDTVADLTVAQRLLGFRPRVSLVDGIVRQARWMSGEPRARSTQAGPR